MSIHQRLRTPMLFVFIVCGMLASCHKNPVTDTAAPVVTTPVTPVKSTARAIPLQEQTFAEGPTQGAVAARLVQATHNDMLPTAYYLAPNDSFHITVTQLAGSTLPQLVVGTPFRDDIRPVRTYYTLTAGANHFKADQYGGLVYVRYVTTGTPTATAKINFGSGLKAVPYYRKGITTQAEWQTTLDSITNVPDVVLETDRTILVVTRPDAITYKNENQALMAAQLDTIIEAEDAISGIDNTNTVHKKGPYKYLITVRDPAAGGYMAAGIALYFTQSLTYRILQPQHVGGVYGWGLWHEAGHIHQQAPWKWTALGEVTVNIYSLAAERAFHVTPSRLNRDGVWAQVDTYFAQPVASRDFNASGTALGVRLALFHQLWMQFGDSLYITMHRQTRTELPTHTSDADKMRYFMLKACTISGKNLTDFFTKWGMPVASSVYTEIAALGLPAPSVDITTLRD